MSYQTDGLLSWCDFIVVFLRSNELLWKIVEDALQSPLCSVGILLYTTYGNKDDIIISRTLSLFEKLQNKFVIYINT